MLNLKSFLHLSPLSFVFSFSQTPQSEFSLASPKLKIPSMKSNFTVTKSFGSSRGSKQKHRKQESEVDEYVKGEKNNFIEAPIENVTASIVTAAETDVLELLSTLASSGTPGGPQAQ